MWPGDLMSGEYYTRVLCMESNVMAVMCRKVEDLEAVASRVM